MCDLVAFVQFKKREKHSSLGVFHVLNCANSTKLRNASHIYMITNIPFVDVCFCLSTVKASSTVSGYVRGTHQWTAERFRFEDIFFTKFCYLWFWVYHILPSQINLWLIHTGKKNDLWLMAPRCNVRTDTKI